MTTRTFERTTCPSRHRANRQSAHRALWAGRSVASDKLFIAWVHCITPAAGAVAEYWFMCIFAGDVDLFAMLDFGNGARINGVGDSFFDLFSESTQKPLSINSAFIFPVDSPVDYLRHIIRGECELS